MNIQIIKTAATNVGRFIVKHSPQILMGVGITSIGAGTIFAVRAGMKTNDILYDHHESIKHLNMCYTNKFDNANTEEAKAIAKKEYNKDAFNVYRDTAFMFAREYWLTVALVGGGIAAIVCGHRILVHRNAVLTAALTSVTDAYNRYRKEVKARYGEETDMAIANGLKENTITVEEVGEDGKKHKHKEIEYVKDGELSPYARFFDESSREWVKAPGYNLTFVKCQQEAANNLLRSRYLLSGNKKRGYVFLNEVYDMLGLDPSPEGALVGWTYHEDEVGSGVGDNYISFGIHDINDPQKVKFEAGVERSILLDFNVDGVIYDQL